MKPDFSGYATKAGLRCSDGRTIMQDAFVNNDGETVPLVWQHGHNDPGNVLGHAVLENRKDGVYARGFFNKTKSGQQAKDLVIHGDVKALSIYANNLVERNKNVIHGAIREVSLVLSGANPGALIDNVSVRHADGGVETLDGDAIIYTGLSLTHSDDEEDSEDSEGDADMATDNQNDNNDSGDNSASEKTVKDVFDALTEEQKNVVYFMIGAALEDAGVDTDDDDSDDSDDSDEDDELEQFNNTPYITHQEAFNMSRNVFEMANGSTRGSNQKSLSHSELDTILTHAQRHGSLKDAFLEHADDYGIQDIDFLFPDAKNITDKPEFIARRMEWVKGVLDGTKKSPFSRVKTVFADITADEARAKGYVKGNLKKEEVIKLLKRKTTPTTIYKKQKLDRDDIVDITDLDVIAWIKAEMRLMLDEEIARAVLIGDGRSVIDEDKIDEDSVRPIAHDDDMYAHQVTLPSNISTVDLIEQIIRARSVYRGSGQPVMYTTLPFLTDMLLLKDKLGRRIYTSDEELAKAFMVSKIVTVEAMEAEPDVSAILVNLNDYTIGADSGGKISMFDDFDIDYNQHKYLIETRISGALTKPKSAVVIRREEGEEVTPASPSFNGSTNTITIPSIEGVIYTIEGIEVEGSEVITSDTEVEAEPAEGYSFPGNTNTHWTFVYSGE